MTIAHILQEAFVLASGVPADPDMLAQFEAMVEEDGSFGRVAAYFEAELGALAADIGVTQTVQRLAFNGLGVSLTHEEAELVTASLLRQGIDSWAELLAFVIDASGAAFDVLDQRAEAAAAFHAALAALEATDRFEGDAVDEAVRLLLQGIDGSAGSLQAAIDALQDLAEELADTGTDPDPDPDPEPDTVAPPAPGTSGVVVAGDGRISAAEAGAFAITAAAGSAEAGARVSITLDDSNAATAPVTAEAIAAANGSFSVSGLDVSRLDDGPLTVTLVATDAAGNASGESSLVARKDTEALAAVRTSAIRVAGDGYINPAEQHDFAIVAGSGTALTNATVLVTIDDVGRPGTAPILAQAVMKQGGFVIDGLDVSGYADGRLNFTFVARDAAGNLSAPSTIVVIKDSVAPTVAVSSSAQMLKEGESATITFTFSEDPGTSFTLDDVSAGGGTFGELSGSGLTRSATFTAEASAVLSTGTVIAVAGGSYTDASGNEGAGGSTAIDTAFNTVLFVGNSATFGRADPVMSYNTYDPVTNPGGVHDLTSPSQGGTFTNMTGANLYEPHDWGGVPGLVDAFADQVGLNYDVSLSTRNAATLRGHYGNTSPAGWDLRGNIASDSWDIVVLQDQTDEPLPAGSGSITFAPGSATATLVITPTGDTNVEYDETLSLALATASSYRVASTSAVTTTILNDDPSAPAPDPSLATVTLATSGSVLEDSGSNIVFTFTRTGSTTSDLTVTFSLARDGSTSPSVATSGAGDFDIYSGSPYRFASGGSSTTGTMSFNNNVGTIVIKAGQSTATLTLDPKTDATVENAEGVQLGLRHANPASPIYNLGTQGIVSAAILNDDFAPGTDLTLPSVALGVGSASAMYENAGGSLVYTFTRSGDTSGALTVNFTGTGTATYFEGEAASSDFSYATTGAVAASLETTSGSNADIAAFEQYATLIENYIHTGAADSVSFPSSPIPANPNANAEADIYLYATWARPDMIVGATDMLTEKILVTEGPNAGGYEGGTISDSGIQSPGYYLRLENMTDDLIAAYTHLAEVNPDFEGVAPVSTAFMQAVQSGLAIRDPYTETPAEGQVNLWFEDNLHASKYGSYLAGLTLFSTLTGLDARVLGAADRVADDLGIDADTAVALQEVAAATLGFDPDLHYTAPGSVRDLGGSGVAALLATAGAYTFVDGTYTSHSVTVQASAGNLGSLEAALRSDGHAGQVNWIYTVDNADVDLLLASGDTRTDTFTLVLDDGHGHTSIEVIGVNLIGG